MFLKVIFKDNMGTLPHELTISHIMKRGAEVGVSGIISHSGCEGFVRVDDKRREHAQSWLQAHKNIVSVKVHTPR